MLLNADPPVSLFRVVFTGKFKEGTDANLAKKNIVKQFRIERPEEIARFFNNSQMVTHEHLKNEEAKTIMGVLGGFGLICQMVEEKPVAEVVAPVATPPPPTLGKTCIKCGGVFDLGGKSNSHYCPACGIIYKTYMPEQLQREQARPFQGQPTGTQSQSQPRQVPPLVTAKAAPSPGLGRQGVLPSPLDLRKIATVVPKSVDLATKISFVSAVKFKHVLYFVAPLCALGIWWFVPVSVLNSMRVVNNKVAETIKHTKSDKLTDVKLEAMQQAAEQGNADAQYLLGEIYLKGQGVLQNDKEALRWLRLAAEKGDFDAQNSLGHLYQYGQGVPVDYYEALKWFRLGAEKGHGTAQYNIGYMFLYGQGVAVDYDEALSWFRLAVERGQVDAQNSLGYMYQYGQGVPVDYDKALRWYRLAVGKGHANAQKNLGVMYERGQGVPKNLNVAISWYRLAAELGDVSAKFFLQNIGERRGGKYAAAPVTTESHGTLGYSCRQLGELYGVCSVPPRCPVDYDFERPDRCDGNADYDTGIRIGIANATQNNMGDITTPGTAGILGLSTSLVVRKKQ